MKGFFKNITSGFLMCLIFVVSGVVYASWTTPTSLKSSPGTLLTSDSWNQAMDNFELLRNSQSVPAGAVLSFNLQECPIGWLPANGSGSITGEDIPDLRGEFIRGLDNGRGIDINRVLGSNQEDMFKSHSHNLKTGYRLTTSPGGAKAFYNDYPDEYTTTYETGGSETRPRNIALLYCIKE